VRGPIRCRRLEVAPSRDRSHQPTAFDSVDVGGAACSAFVESPWTAGVFGGKFKLLYPQPEQRPSHRNNGSATLDFVPDRRVTEPTRTESAAENIGTAELGRPATVGHTCVSRQQRSR